MEDSEIKRELFYRDRKRITCIVIMIIVFQLVIIIPNLSYDSNSEYEISHSLTVWILPLEEEFWLHLNFYSSHQDAAEAVSSWAGVSMLVQPSADEEHTRNMTIMDENLLSVWMRIWFDDDYEETFTVLRIDFGQKKNTTLLDREISILIQPYLG